MGRDEDYAISMIFSDPSPHGHINQRICNAFVLNLDKVDLNKQEHDQFIEIDLMVAKKLAMTWRHLNRYREIEDGLIEKVRDTPLRVDGKRTGFDYSDELYGEFDGFLVQLKSALDYLVRIPVPIFGARKWTFGSFGDKGEKVIKMLERSTPTEFAEGIATLREIIQENQPWLEQLIALRDKVSHFKDGGVAYQYFRVSKEERDGQEGLFVPMWSEDRTVRDALGAVWRKLICFCEEFIGFTLYLRLKAYWVFRYTRIEDEGESCADPEAEDPRWEFQLDLETLREEELKE